MKVDPATFQCRRCGACCRVPGYVALEPGEPEAIAAFLGLDVYAFKEQSPQSESRLARLNAVPRAAGTHFGNLSTKRVPLWETASG